MNLLVIEDDRKLNRMLCEILEKEGYTVYLRSKQSHSCQGF